MMATNLATAARFETDERERRYPALVARGKIGAQLAEDDTECWHLIARAFETGVKLEDVMSAHRGPRMAWSDIRAALDRATDSRQRACAHYPDDATLAARRDGVVAISDLIRPRAQFWCELNDALRQRAIDAHPATAKAA